MKQRLIAIYGGTNLSPAEVDFVKHLSKAILARDEFILVTGGFGHYKKHPERVSTDRAAQGGATEFLERRRISVNDRLKTMPRNG